MKKLLKNKKGFTLIELIVVIAVLGMIAAIAIPKVGSVTSNARDRADEQTILILNEAIERYHAHNGEAPAGSDAHDIVTVLKASDNGGPYLGDDVTVYGTEAASGVELPSDKISKYSGGKFVIGVDKPTS